MGLLGGMSNAEGKHGKEGVLDQMVNVGGIFQSNAFNLQQLGRAVFIKVSRTNHSCAPNAQTCFVPGEWLARDPKVTEAEKGEHGVGRMVVHAARDIEKGEEINIAYFSVLMEREWRKKRARDWRFECKCRVCDEDAEGAEEMEESRRVVREWLQGPAAELEGEGDVSIEHLKGVIEQGDKIVEMMERDRSGLSISLAIVLDALAMLQANLVAREGRDGKEARAEIVAYLQKAALVEARISGRETPATVRRCVKLGQFAAVKGRETVPKVVQEGESWRMEWGTKT